MEKDNNNNINIKRVAKRVEYSQLKGRLRMEEVADLHDKVFLRDEPINKWFHDIGIYYDEECLKAMRADLMRKLAQGHSIMATDPETGDVVAGRISFKFNRFKAQKLFDVDERLQQHIRWKLDTIIFDNSWNFEKLLEPYPHVREVMIFLSLFVRPDYRCMGIASELVRRSIEVAKKSGCDCIIVCATSDATKTVFEKLGFTHGHTLYYEDLDLSEFPLDPSLYKGQFAATYLLQL